MRRPKASSFSLVVLQAVGVGRVDVMRVDQQRREGRAADLHGH